LLAIQDGQNIDELNIGVDLTDITEQRAVAGCNGDSDGYGDGSCYLVGSLHRNGKSWRAGGVYFADTPGPYYKNDWHFVEAYFKLNSIFEGKGIADGIMRYWYDDQLIIDHDDVVLRTGQYPDMKFNQFMIAPWIGDGSPVDQTVWVDNLTVATSRPSTEPDLVLSGTPADQAIHLTWSVNTTLPMTSTWRIEVPPKICTTRSRVYCDPLEVFYEPPGHRWSVKPTQGKGEGTRKQPFPPPPIGQTNDTTRRKRAQLRQRAYRSLS
jgi:hypothetical protein